MISLKLDLWIFWSPVQTKWKVNINFRTTHTNFFFFCKSLLSLSNSAWERPKQCCLHDGFTIIEKAQARLCRVKLRHHFTARNEFGNLKFYLSLKACWKWNVLANFGKIVSLKVLKLGENARFSEGVKVDHENRPCRRLLSCFLGK